MARRFSITPLLFVIIALLCLLQSHAVQSAPDVIKQVTAEEDGASNGVCSGIGSPATCPVNCFRADPVCGVDGVTYWCGCQDATCHGARVAKVGPCEVGSGGSASLPGQALLLVHIVWLVFLGFSLLFGLF